MKISSIIVLSFVLLSSTQISAQEFGKASYIDLAYQGGITASNEPYDGNQFTAAHKIHPFGTQLKVTREDNGRSVIVRVNDRGPHIKGRIIDLSYAAAKALDMVRDGVIDVKVEVIGKATAAKQVSNTPATTTKTANAIEAVTPNDYQSNPGTTTTKGVAQKTDVAAPKSTSPVTKNQSTDYGDRLLTKNYEKYGLYEIKILEVNKAGYGIQVASLSSYENAMKQLTRLQAKKIDNALLSVEQTSGGGMAFKVIVGPYETRDLAKKQEGRLNRLLKVKGFVVDLSTISY
jgi:rare lipoprotein A